MNKLRIWIVVCVVTVLMAACQPVAAPAPGVPPTEAPTPGVSTLPAPSSTPDVPGAYTAAAFEIEGARVQLVNGLSETPAAVTRYFGNDAMGDINGDGQEDAVFLVTQESGGSGTFFYLVTALREGSGHTGVNAVLLGDRIAPQSMRIQDGLIVVNYADRKPGDSFTTPPSVGITRSFKIEDSKLVETILPGQITNRPWKWVRTQMNDGALDSPIQTDAFTITFGEDGKVAGATDCNRFSGTYMLQENQLSFGPLASTKMFCEGSQETQFLKALSHVRSYLTVDNQLVLELEMDSGQMIFE